jgi:hypothetical protein
LISTNITFINYIKELELVLLNHYSKEFNIHKKINYNLFSQMISGKTKIYKNNCSQNPESYINPNPNTNPNTSSPSLSYSHANPNILSQSYSTDSFIPKESTLTDILDISYPGHTMSSNLPICPPIHMRRVHTVSSIPSLSIDRLSYTHPPGFAPIKTKIQHKSNSHRQRFVLKIYGIWENNYEIGLTYRFIEMFSV